MDMTIIAEVIKILKSDDDLYARVKAMFDEECLDEDTVKELAAKAMENGIPLDSEDLADRLDSLINDGINGMNINAMGGFDALINMASGMLDNE